MAKLMHTGIYHITATWTKGWSLARGVPAPVPMHDGWHTLVAWPQQKERYVFAEISDGYMALANTVTEPLVFLKVCASPEAVRAVLPVHWQLQSAGYMMTCFKLPANTASLPGAYTLNVINEGAITTAQVLTSSGEVAAKGHIVFVDGYAIYDRIETHADHRRRGLAAVVMQTLTRMAAEQDIIRGILVATADGKLLYEKLGWQVCSEYTTAVITGA